MIILTSKSRYTKQYNFWYVQIMCLWYIQNPRINEKLSIRIRCGGFRPHLMMRQGHIEFNAKSEGEHSSHHTFPPAG